MRAVWAFEDEFEVGPRDPSAGNSRRKSHFVRCVLETSFARQLVLCVLEIFFGSSPLPQENVGVPVARRFMSKGFGRQRLCRAEEVAKARAAALLVGGGEISDE